MQEYAVSFCNLLLSSLYNNHYSRADLSLEQASVATRCTFQSLCTIPELFGYEIEEFIRLSMRYRFLYCSVAQLRIFADEGLRYYFEQCTVMGARLRDSPRGHEKVERCIAITLCAALDKSLFAKVSRDVVLYIAQKARDLAYEFPWVIHKAEMSALQDSEQQSGTDKVATYFCPRTEIEFFLAEGEEKNALRKNILTTAICGRVVDSLWSKEDHLLLLKGHNIPKIEDGHRPEEDRVYLANRNPYLFRHNIEDYVSLRDDSGNRLSISQVRKAMAWDHASLQLTDD